MKDVLGRELAVGDPVVFVCPTYSRLERGNVLKINEKQVTISSEKIHKSDKGWTTRFPYQVSKI